MSLSSVAAGVQARPGRLARPLWYHPGDRSARKLSAKFARQEGEESCQFECPGHGPRFDATVGRDERTGDARRARVRDTRRWRALAVSDAASADVAQPCGAVILPTDLEATKGILRSSAGVPDRLAPRP